MKFGMSIRNMDKFADLDGLVDLAVDAEKAGWDGIFLWDHMLHRSTIRRAIIDPWIALAAIAVETKKLVLGPMITPLARRRPWKVARETVTLDHLSRGRVILGVGLGWPRFDDFERFGDEGDEKIRAERLDEGLQVLQGLWRGEPFEYVGKHFQIAQNTVFLPKPYGDKAFIPIWVGGGRWPRKRRPFRRAARFNGCYPEYHSKDGTKVANYFENLKTYIKRFRANLDAFDFVVMGQAPRKQEPIDAFFAPILKTGTITWWIEKVYNWAGNLETIRKKVRKGPPSLYKIIDSK